VPLYKFPDRELTAPAGSTAASINSLIADASALAGSSGVRRTVTLQAGTYTLEAPISASNNVALVGDPEGATVLYVNFSGTVHDPFNAAIRAVGALDTGRLSTTLAAFAAKGSRYLQLTSTGSGLYAGGYLSVSGNNLASSYPQDALLESNGTGSILGEVVQIASTYTTGTLIPLAWGLRQHHGTTGITVTACNPVVNFEARDLTIVGNTGSYTTAVGFYGRQSINLEANGLRISNMTRAMVECEFVKGFRSVDVVSRGRNNGWFHMLSVADGDVSRFDGTDGVDRTHTLGYPRYPFLLRNRCTGFKVYDGVLKNAHAGMYMCGGEHVMYDDIRVQNIQLTQEVYDRMVASGDLGDSARIVLGWGCGFGPLGIAEFAFDVQVSNIQVDDVHAPTTAAWTGSPFRAMAYYIHDVFRFQGTNISCVNRGDESYSSGIVFSDMAGNISNLQVAGFAYGIGTENVSTNLRVTNFNFEGRKGDSPNSSIPFFLNHGAGSHYIHFDGVRFGSGFSFMRFGGSFAGDSALVFENIQDDNTHRWARAIMAYNNTGVTFTRGNTVEIDPTNTSTDLRVRVPATGSVNLHRRLAICVGGSADDYGTGYLLVAPLNGGQPVSVLATGSVAYGDVMEYSNTNQFYLQSNSASTASVGVAVSRKASTAAGWVDIV
jgi:hypothetical protein